MTHFDKHKPGECISPDKIGLVQDDKGVWKAPGEREFFAKAAS